MDRLYINAEADRMTVAGILIKNGYMVRGGSGRRSGTRSYDYYLEFELGTKKDCSGRLYIDEESDQLAVAVILVKNKYTVRSFSNQRKNCREYFYLEYYPNPEHPAAGSKSEEA